MTVRIVYYSLSGTTARVARRLAPLLDAELAEVRCPRYQGGKWRYALAAIDSVRGFRPEIDAPGGVGEAELVVLGAPVWAMRPAPPIRSFIERTARLPRRVGIFMTAGDARAGRSALPKFEALLPMPPVAKFCTSAGEMEQPAFRQTLEAFAAELRVPFTPRAVAD